MRDRRAGGTWAMAATLGALFLAPACRAATVWAESIGAPDREWITAAALGGDGSIFAVGFRVPEAVWTPSGLVAHVDASGHAIWSQWREPPSAFYACAVLPLPAGESLIAGYNRTPDDTADVGWFLRLDAAGQRLWERAYDHTNVVFQGLAARQDGGYVATGGASGYGTGVAALLVGINATGDPDWEVALEDGAWSQPLAVLATRSGGYLVVGSRMAYGGSEHDAYVLSFDSNHTLTYAWTLGGPNNDSFNAVTEMANGEFIAVGFTGGRTGAPGSPWIVRFTSLGSVLWQTTYSQAPTWMLSGVAATADDGVLAVGQSGGVVRVAADGTGSWYANLPVAPNAPNYSCIVPTADGGYVIGGDAFNRGAGSIDGWLLKLDTADAPPDGCWTTETGASFTATTFTSRYLTLFGGNANLNEYDPTPTVAHENDYVVLPACPPPGEVTGVRVQRTAGDVDLSWDPLADATSYEVYRGALLTLASAGYDHDTIGACGLTATQQADPVASDGADYYYLIVGRNRWGTGPYGWSSLGASTPPAITACP